MGEFTAEEKEVIFSDPKLRKMLIESIQEKGVEEPEGVIINLALEFLLESLEDSKKTDFGQDKITSIKEGYLAINFDFIKANVL